jgi:hypothetical protein
MTQHIPRVGRGVVDGPETIEVAIRSIIWPQRPHGDCPGSSLDSCASIQCALSEVALNRPNSPESAFDPESGWGFPIPQHCDFVCPRPLIRPTPRSTLSPGRLSLTGSNLASRSSSAPPLPSAHPVMAKITAESRVFLLRWRRQPRKISRRAPQQRVKKFRSPRGRRQATPNDGPNESGRRGRGAVAGRSPRPHAIRRLSVKPLSRSRFTIVANGHPNQARSTKYHHSRPGRESLSKCNPRVR